MSSTTNGSTLPPLAKTDLKAPSPQKPGPPPASVGHIDPFHHQPRLTLSKTPSRAADPMSFSNILSSAEPAPKPRAPSPVPEVTEPEPDHDTEVEREVETEPEPVPVRSKDVVVKKRGGRKSTKGRASDIRDAATPKAGRRSSVKKESPTPRPPAKRQANGQPKAKTWSTEMEKKIQNAEIQIENNVTSLDSSEFDEDEHRTRAQKRRRIMADLDEDQNRLRRDEYANLADKKLLRHADLGKRRYDDVFYDEALHEVREQELYAEKERKKDMQRKRRREKSMAVTMELKEAALARAYAAEDETERQKHLRDAERANKKAQQTKLILQKGIKGPARNVELNLEGGSTSAFPTSDVESGEKRKGKGRGGPRLKKSKEQKQAEKDAAEAAQAALDAGEELPTKEENRVRIKIKKSKGDKADQEGEEEKKPEKSAKEKVDDIPENEKRYMSKGYNQIYDQIWRDMARKDVNKTFKLAVDSYATKASNLKKTAILASKEA